MYKNYDEENFVSISSTDYDLLFQSTKQIYCKIDLLDIGYNKIGEITGCVSDCNYSEDSSSDIRRTVNLTFSPDEQIGFGENKAIWYDKNIRVKIGYLHLESNTIRWYSVGIYLYDIVNSTFNESGYSISVSGVDLCARLNGEHGGTIAAKEMTILQGSNLYEVVLDIAAQCPYINRTKIVISKEAMAKDDGSIYYDYPIIPYDLEFQTGTSWLEILKTIRDLYIGYEFFFDDDEFIYQPIQTDEYSPVILNSEQIQQILVSEDSSYDLKEVKNITEVWGKCHEVDHFSPIEKVTYDSTTGIYTLTMDSLDSLTNDVLFGFTASATNSNLQSCRICIMTSNGVCLTPEDDTPDSIGSYPLKYDVGEDIPPNFLITENSYILKYKSKYFYYVGQHQISAVVKLVSTPPTEAQINKDKQEFPVNVIDYVVDRDSPFCTDKIGDRLQTLSGGEYESIYTDKLALERAQYENWLKTDLIDTSTLECVNCPFLHVNQKIEHKPRGTDYPQIYDVLSKNPTPMSGTMTLNIKKHKDVYPWVKQNKE